MDNLFSIEDLHVDFDTPDGRVEAVRGVSMQVQRGETVALVGESGSGKSQIMMAALGLLANNGRSRGRVRFQSHSLLELPEKKLNALRGSRITTIFQEPMTSLDPLYTIESQLCMPLRVHGGLSRRAARQRALELLELVQIRHARQRRHAYPHELSGGQRQRVMIAMALANSPELLIADEPTTALDVTVQADILRLLSSLQKRLGMAIIFITHDLGIVEAFADRVYVMHRGKVVESGPSARIFAAPEQDYTRMLLAAEPQGGKAPVPAQAEVLLRARDLHVTFGRQAGWLRADTQVQAVRGVSLQLRRKQTLGIVGESGSGKSTLGRALLRLLPCSGDILYLDKALPPRGSSELRRQRADLQIVFQDPYGALSPRMTVGNIISEGLRVHAQDLSSAERDRRVIEVLDDVGLEPLMRHRFPHEFSGGQRQRIAIARALILRPKLIVLDEPTSALDRSVQKQIVELLRRLQETHALTYIFISHDLAVVRAMADEVMVMQEGQVVEFAPTEQIFQAPQQAYTRQLLGAAFALGDMLAEAEPA